MTLRGLRECFESLPRSLHGAFADLELLVTLVLKSSLPNSTIRWEPFTNCDTISRKIRDTMSPIVVYPFLTLLKATRRGRGGTTGIEWCPWCNPSVFAMMVSRRAYYGSYSNDALYEKPPRIKPFVNPSDRPALVRQNNIWTYKTL